MLLDIPVSPAQWAEHFGIPEGLAEQHMVDWITSRCAGEGVELDYENDDNNAPSQDVVHAAGMPWAIDPRDCGCTECLVGEYVPERLATPEHWQRVLDGTIFNNTHGTYRDLRLKAISVLYGV